MKKFQQNSILTGVSLTPNCDNRDLTTPSACGSHPFKKLKGNLFPNLTPLRPYALTVFLFLLLAPFASRAQTTITLNDGQVHSLNISVGTVLNPTTIHVTGGTAYITGIIFYDSSAIIHLLKKTGPGKLIIASSTPANPNAIPTLQVNEGTFQIGLANTSGVNVQGWARLDGLTTIAEGATLRFQPYEDMMTVNQPIGGAGKVEYKGDYNKRLLFTADNTYTGGTTIEAGHLYVGNNTDNGSIAGNVNVASGAILVFYRKTNVTYSGVISGAGQVNPSNTNNTTITFTGANTYTGSTVIHQWCTLALGSTGSIASSSEVRFNSSNSCKLNISAGDKTIKALNSTSANSEVVLGNGSTLTINTGKLGSSTNSSFAGKITGAGNLTVSGAGKVTLTGANTYTGSTTVEASTIVAGAATLQLGDGIKNGTIANTSGVTVESYTAGGTNYAILRFELGANMEFGKVISGGGRVQLKGAGKILTLTAANSYTGSTTIEATTPTTDLYIGNGGNSGSLDNSNVVNNGQIWFNRSDAHSYSGVISGTGNLGKLSNGTLTLNGANTFTGGISIYAGTLALGASGTVETCSYISLEDNAAKFNISAGNKTIKSLKSSAANAEVVLGSKTLTIGIAGQNNGSSVFAGKITGTSGSVTKTGTATLYLTGANSYTGTTTISEGIIGIGNNTDAGTIAGPIVNNAGLVFDRKNDYPHAGNISGTGYVTQQGTAKLTLNGTLSYTGETRINKGTLALGSGANIESSAGVVFTGNTTPKFDISAANKTIKALNNGTYTAAEVVLGDKTLTLGTAGQDNGTGAFSGKFSGTGGNVTKQGLGTFTINNTANTANGIFNLVEGTLKMTGNWAGNFTKSSNANFEIIGNVSVGGTLTMGGGNTTMNLTSSPPSKITVTGAVSTSVANTLNITTGAVTGAVLITASSGITNPPSLYTVNSPGMSCTLTANAPTQLLLTATVSDNTAPTPGNSGVITGTATEETVNLSWTAGDDNITPVSQLRYFVYQSLSNNISTVANCETNGTLLNPGGTQGITTFNAIGLTPNTNYYFNVVLADMANNKAAYVAKALNTTKATLSGLVIITGNTVFGETLTANTDALSSTPNIPELGTLTYQWKRNDVPIGTNVPTYTLTQADIDATLTVTVTAANCTGEVTSASSATVTKASQAAPPAPTAATITSSSITLNTIEGCEYRINGGTWQSSPIFTGLQPKTTYAFEAYKVETNTHNASPASTIANITTGEGEEEPQVLNIEISPKTATVLPGQTKKFTATVSAIGGADQSVTWSVSGQTSMLTKISSDGLLTVGNNETADTLIVKVVSVFAPTFFDVANVSTKEGTEPEVYGIEISPKSATVLPTKTQQFTAQVFAVGGADETITWMVDGNESTKTVITAEGLLTVGSNETAETISVFAVSNFNPTVYDMVTVYTTNVGIEPITNDELRITVYPNPTTGELTIENGELRIKSVELYDVMGKKLFEEKENLTVLRSYDLTVFPNGVYFVRIATEQGVVTKKVIKQ